MTSGRIKFPQLWVILYLLAGWLLPPNPAAAENNDDPITALTSGKVSFEARYRYEYVDQAGLPNKAEASTLRTRLGYHTGSFLNFGAAVEFENTTRLGQANYNDTINGKTTYPIVADPEDTNVGQAYISWSGIPGAKATVGRQIINLDNQRFVSAGAWRQNDQTFDGVTVNVTSIPHLALFYAYITGVNRVYGTRSSMGEWGGSHIQLINAAYQATPHLKITGYGYFLDIPAAPAASSKTIGFRLTGEYPLKGSLKATYAAEYAHQTDYKSNPAAFSLNYYLLEPGLAYRGLAFKLGFERLGGNGISAFQTPLGTLHALNGWADKFTTTPAAGLIDKYAVATCILPDQAAFLKGAAFTLAYHNFAAIEGDITYGREWDAMISESFFGHYSLALKFADYHAQTYSTNSRKIMIQTGVKF